MTALPFLTPSTLNIAARADAIGCVMNDNSAPVMAANVAALNNWFESLKYPYDITRSVLVIPKGRLYVDDEILIPGKNSPIIIGCGGLGYRTGLYNYTWPGQGGLASQIISLAGDATKAIIRTEASGLKIVDLQLQGQEIPTGDGSGTGTKIGYAIRSEPMIQPASGKNHFADLAIINCGTAFYHPGTMHSHADLTDYGKLCIFGCDKILDVRNLNSIGHNFYGIIEFAGDGINAGQIGFDIHAGGDIHVRQLHWNCFGGTVMRFRSSSFSQNNNDYSFRFRNDTLDPLNPEFELQETCLLDMSDTTNNDYPFHVRMSGSVNGIHGVDYDADLLIKLAPGATRQGTDIAHDMQVWYGGADWIERNAARADHAAFNAYRYPMTPYHELESAP